MAREIPEVVRAAAGLAATVLDEARKLPETLPGLPVRLIGLAMQSAMKVQQQYAGFVARGDELFTGMRGEDEPGLATFDDDEPLPASTGYRESAFDRAGDTAPTSASLDLILDLEVSAAAEAPDTETVLDEIAIDELVDQAPTLEETAPATPSPATKAPAKAARKAAKAPAKEAKPAAKATKPVKETKPRKSGKGASQAEDAAVTQAATEDTGTATTPAPTAADTIDAEPTADVATTLDVLTPAGDVATVDETVTDEGVAAPEAAEAAPAEPETPVEPAADTGTATDTDTGTATDTDTDTGTATATDEGGTPVAAADGGAATGSDAGDAGGGAAPSAPANTPVDGYDTFTVAQLRGRLRGYTLTTVQELVAYEQATRARAPYLTMLRNRLEKLEEQAIESSPLAPRGA